MERFLTVEQVCEMLSITRVTLWTWRRHTNNGFPAPLSLPSGNLRWRLSDIDAWTRRGAK